MILLTASLPSQVLPSTLRSYTEKCVGSQQREHSELKKRNPKSFVVLLRLKNTQERFVDTSITSVDIS